MKKFEDLSEETRASIGRGLEDAKNGNVVEFEQVKEQILSASGSPGASNTEDGKLERLAEAIRNKGLTRVKLSPDCKGLHFQDECFWYQSDDPEDRHNSEFIIWGLDRLEELLDFGVQATISLATGKEDGSHGYQVLAVVNPLHSYCTKIGEGSTRADAIANALLAALTSKENVSNG